MKKSIILILLMIFIIDNSIAQGYVFNIFKNARNQDRSKAVIVGLKGGYTINYMHFSDKDYNSLDGSTLNKPAYGLYIEIPIKKKLSIAPEVLMMERGMTKKYVWRNEIPTTDIIDAKYVDLRVPVIYRFLSGVSVKPYVFVAPDIAFCYGGTIDKNYDVEPNVLQQNNITDPDAIEIAKSDAVMSQFALSALVGAGVRYDINFQSFSLILKFDLGYNLGLTNTYSKAEKNGTAQLGNVNAYDPERIGKRFNRGFEAMLSIGLPLHFSEKGCSNFGNKRRR